MCSNPQYSYKVSINVYSLFYSSNVIVKLLYERTVGPLVQLIWH